MSRLSAAKQYNATLLPVKFNTQSDAVLAVVSRQYELSETVGWEVSMDDDGECLVKTTKGTVSAPLKVGQLISLSSFGSFGYSPYDKMKVFVCHTSSSHFKKRRAILVEDIGNGVWGEKNIKLSGIVPIDVFADACREAIVNGEIVKKPGKESVTALDALLINVGIGIVKCPFRLDHALALLKRLGNRDVYGDKLLGAIPFYADNETHRPKWKLIYDINEDGSVKDGDVASIDHVDPKSKGGSDRLVNMQLMRKQDNSKKGDNEFEALADPSTTMEVLKFLSQGIISASEGESPKLEPEFAYDIMLIIRKEMKAAESTAKKFARRYEKAMNAIAKQLEKTDKEKGSLKKKANAKKRHQEKEAIETASSERKARRRHKTDSCCEKTEKQSQNTISTKPAPVLEEGSESDSMQEEKPARLSPDVPQRTGRNPKKIVKSKPQDNDSNAPDTSDSSKSKAGKRKKSSSKNPKNKKKDAD